MKKHVEYEHLELVTAYVEQLVTANNISGSQVVGDEGYRTFYLKMFQSNIKCDFYIFWEHNSL